MVTILLTALVFLLAAQQPSTPKPAFKSSVTVIDVDVVVTDRSGRPVRGLGRDDFEISEDGKPVDIVSFSAVDLPEAPRESVIPEPERSGSAYASNDRPDDGRVILIALDDVQVSLTSGRMMTVKTVARRAVERLGPGDVAAVVTTSGRVGGQAEFTTDKARLLAAIDRFVPQGEHELPAIAAPSSSAGGANSPADRIAERRTQAAMAGLSAAARVLATIPHRRKGVLLISQGFPATLEEIIREPRIGAAWESIREFMATAQRSNVAVYTVDPCGLESDPGCTRASRQNLRTIAELTGGFAVTNTNTPETAVDRLLAENGTYYLLGYSSPAPPNDGKHHQINVRTRVADVQIRAREGYDSPDKAAKPLVATPLEALARSAIQTRGLTMRAVVIPAPLAAPPSAAVVVGIELPTSVATRAGRVEFSLVAMDENGKTRARVRFTTNFAGSGETSSPWMRTGSRIDLLPGQYQIRIIAVGADRSQGSIFVDVSVPKFGAEIGVGGLSLGAPSSGRVTEADRLRDVLPLIPLATNEIDEGTAINAQLPIQVSSKAASTPLAITATLKSGDGSTRLLDWTRGSTSDYARAGGRVYRVALPRTLNAGSYRIVVQSTLGRSAVTRELAFSVVPRADRPR